eukprot:CAMPEP_0180781296 /NCGR_PEP_ID=MMETSP1038_2-20121128/47563_1 /TAXON_ID=632150 /ORGANISM="Azadinium spinosum, Strain 3D9" /LENGTH=32 /DNA_ID= /DNA_START= /DNA_END= /DNA_ORIENTATION=
MNPDTNEARPKHLLRSALEAPVELRRNLALDA